MKFMSTIRSVVNIFGNIAANWFFISWRVHSAVFGHRYWFIVTHFAVSMAAFKVSFLFVDSQTLPQPNLICSELRRNWFFFSSGERAKQNLFSTFFLRLRCRTIHRTQMTFVEKRRKAKWFLLIFLPDNLCSRRIECCVDANCSLI